MTLRARAYETYHLAKYSCTDKTGCRGFLTMSVDFEMIKDSATVKREIMGMNALLEFSQKHNFSMTFAVVGKIIEKDGSLIDRIIQANPRNEIGSHTYSHKFFNEISMHEARDEISKSSEILASNGIRPMSFVFPRNIVKYLELLEESGFLCFRSFRKQKHALSLPRKRGRLWEMPQSLFVSSERNPGPLVSMAGIAKRKGLQLHLWCHPYNWGNSPTSEIERVLGPLAEYCKRNGMRIMTMKEAAEFCESD